MNDFAWKTKACETPSSAARKGQGALTISEGARSLLHKVELMLPSVMRTLAQLDCSSTRSTFAPSHIGKYSVSVRASNTGQAALQDSTQLEEEQWSPAGIIETGFS